MSQKIFSAGRTIESVAYDMALALAAKDPSITTPEALIQRIADFLPACRDAAKEKYKTEAPEPPKPIKFKW